MYWQAIGLGALLAVAVAWYPILQYVRKAEARARRETRHRLIDHLRANPRGLLILDNVLVRDTTLESDGPVTVFGDYVTLINNHFTSKRHTAIEAES